MAVATTIADLERISADRLKDLVLAQAQQEIENPNSGSKVAIVDVRDDGGHIKSSLHFPSGSLDATMPTLLRQLADKDTVVFHCALSQQRGPAAALRYLREREAQQAHQQQAKAEGKGVAEGDKEEKGTGNGNAETELKVKQQKVYVLDRGFVGWQEVYGPDERLTEAWRKELWEEGY
ncbi:hypothetical protein DL765_010955 [Monosporascus sp. GIB2]|nr:hypothetical protein DL765_010955 [Monosporascus sp. GIB2]